MSADNIRPAVAMVGEDGNAFAILGRCKAAAKRAGWSPEQWARFSDEATAGDYDHLIQTVIRRFAVDAEGDEEGGGDA